jgi:haloalkane dehalogenase
VRPFDRSLFPYEPRTFDRGGGIRMRYLDEGPAKPAGTVVLVHGNPSWSFYWRNLVRELSTTHRCLAPDHVGMGASDKPGDGAYAYTLRERVADLTRLLEAVAPRGPLTLVVHDWGGMIGMAWAVEHLARVQRLVLLNTAAFPLPAAKRLPWQLALARTPLGALLVRGGNAFAYGATLAGMTRTRMSPAVRAGYLAPYDSWGARIATLRFVQDIPLVQGARGFDLVQATAARLDELRATPTFIGWGGQDFVFDHHFLAEWRARLPHATVRLLPDAGHYVLEDAAAELVPEIAAFARAA